MDWRLKIVECKEIQKESQDRPLFKKPDNPITQYVVKTNKTIHKRR